MLLLILFLIIFGTAFSMWTQRVVRKTLVSPDIPPSKIFWQIVRKMAWRMALIVFIVFPLLLSLTGGTPERAGMMCGVGIFIGLILYPIFLLKAMYDSKQFLRMLEQPTKPKTDSTSSPPPLPPLLKPPSPSPANEKSFYINLRDEIKGPYSFEQIQALLSTGAISLETRCRNEGSQEWRFISDVV